MIAPCLQGAGLRGRFLFAVLEHLIAKRPPRWNALCELYKKRISPQIVHDGNKMHKPEHQIKPGMRSLYNAESVKPILWQSSDTQPTCLNASEGLAKGHRTKDIKS
jgi:hypothetical protein